MRGRSSSASAGGWWRRGPAKSRGDARSEKIGSVSSVDPAELDQRGRVADPGDGRLHRRAGARVGGDERTIRRDAGIGVCRRRRQAVAPRASRQRQKSCVPCASRTRGSGSGTARRGGAPARAVQRDGRRRPRAAARRERREGGHGVHSERQAAAAGIEGVRDDRGGARSARRYNRILASTAAPRRRARRAAPSRPPAPTSSHASRRDRPLPPPRPRSRATSRRRRTFAIISHPDAGKTTLTEKLLLFGGAIQLAGTVKARKSARHATSDWMEVEKQRGISVTSSVMQFEYAGHVINLLDTPGHQDFSEDTYRVLTAVDAAVMVIDAAKGVEAQTIKLFEVCRLRDMPIITFVNKMDREVREPLALLDEIESVLGDRVRAGHLAARHGPPLQGRVRPARRHAAALRARRGTRVRRHRDDPRARQPAPRRARARRCRRAAPRRRAAAQREPPVLAARRSSRAGRARCSSAPGINNFGVREILQALCRLGAAAAAARRDDAQGRSGGSAVHRLRVQDPGEHGPAPSRPHRVLPRVLGTLRAGDQGAAPARAPRDEDRQRAHLHGQRARRVARTRSPATSSASTTTGSCRSATRSRSPASRSPTPASPISRPSCSAPRARAIR